MVVCSCVAFKSNNVHGPSVLKLWPLLIGNPSNRLLLYLLWASPRHKNLSRPSFASPGSLCLGSSWVHLLSSPLDHDSTNSIVYINMSHHCRIIVWAPNGPKLLNYLKAIINLEKQHVFLPPMRVYNFSYPNSGRNMCFLGMTRKNLARVGTAGCWFVRLGMDYHGGPWANHVESCNQLPSGYLT